MATPIEPRSIDLERVEQRWNLCVSVWEGERESFVIGFPRDGRGFVMIETRSLDSLEDVERYAEQHIAVFHARGYFDPTTGMATQKWRDAHPPAPPSQIEELIELARARMAEAGLEPWLE